MPRILSSWLAVKDGSAPDCAPKPGNQVEITRLRLPHTPELPAPPSGSTSLALGGQHDSTGLAIKRLGSAVLCPVTLASCPSLGLCSLSLSVIFPQQPFLPQRENPASSLQAARRLGWGPCRAKCWLYCRRRKVDALHCSSLLFLSVSLPFLLTPHAPQSQKGQRLERKLNRFSPICVLCVPG